MKNANPESSQLESPKHWFIHSKYKILKYDAILQDNFGIDTANLLFFIRNNHGWKDSFAP